MRLEIQHALHESHGGRGVECGSRESKGVVSANSPIDPKMKKVFLGGTLPSTPLIGECCD